MLTTIEEASKNFCTHQIRDEYTITDGVTDKETLIAYIDIDASDGKKHRVYIASDEPFMQKIAKAFIEEEKSDEETLKDMTLETANLIIGSAKVIAEESDADSYTINTPFFEKVGTFDFSYDDAKTIKLKDAEMTIAIKELDV